MMHSQLEALKYLTKISGRLKNSSRCSRGFVCDLIQRLRYQTFRMRQQVINPYRTEAIREKKVMTFFRFFSNLLPQQPNSIRLSNTLIYRKGTEVFQIQESLLNGENIFGTTKAVITLKNNFYIYLILPLAITIQL